MHILKEDMISRKDVLELKEKYPLIWEIHFNIGTRKYIIFYHSTKKSKEVEKEINKFFEKRVSSSVKTVIIFAEKKTFAPGFDLKRYT